MTLYKQLFCVKISGRVILCVLLWPIFSYSNEPDKPFSARNAGLGGCAIAISDPWSIFNNQAGLGWQRNYWTGVYHEKEYFIKDLNNNSLGGCIPVKPGTFGLGLNHFGYNQFSQTRFGLAYGMMLSKTIAAGVGINYHSVHLTGMYGGSECITTEGGIIYQPHAKVTFGAHVFNPTRSSLGSSQNLSTSFGIGLAYRPVDNVLIVIQGDDNTQSSPVFRTGIEYSPVTSLSIRAGLLSNPMSLSFGLGWRLKSICFDLAFTYHEVLGYTPYISLAYTFNGKPKIQDKAER